MIHLSIYLHTYKYVFIFIYPANRCWLFTRSCGEDRWALGKVRSDFSNSALFHGYSTLIFQAIFTMNYYYSLFLLLYIDSLCPSFPVKVLNAGIINFAYLFLIAWGLHCCAWAFSGCGDRELLPSRGAWVSHCGVFSCGRARAVGMGAQQLWHTGSADPQHVGSPRTRDWTRVPCIHRRILNQWTTREVQGWDH